jgi:hypothetical protein
MPHYRLAIEGDAPPFDDEPRWFANDVEALKALGIMAAELAANNPGSTKFVIATRTSRAKTSRDDT